MTSKRSGGEKAASPLTSGTTTRSGAGRSPASASCSSGSCSSRSSRGCRGSRSCASAEHVRAAFDHFTRRRWPGGATTSSGCCTTPGIVRNRAKIEATIANASDARAARRGRVAVRGLVDRRAAGREGQATQGARVPVPRTDHRGVGDAGVRRDQRPQPGLPPALAFAIGWWARPGLGHWAANLPRGSGRSTAPFVQLGHRRWPHHADPRGYRWPRARAGRTPSRQRPQRCDAVRPGADLGRPRPRRRARCHRSCSSGSTCPAGRPSRRSATPRATRSTPQQ